MDQCLIFLVFTGFKLLHLEPLDCRAARADVEFETFQAQLAIHQRVVGLFHRGLVGRQLGLCPRLVLRQFFEIFGERQQAAVTVLENQQRTNFIKHAPCLNARPANDKDLECGTNEWAPMSRNCHARMQQRPIPMEETGRCSEL